MIPFASQRAGGQDLATHLMNAQDNEYIEVAQVRGAIARDLHGAFAEWEAQAHALTRCRQYLCSLSVNPDELQGRLTRAQYLDYIDRAEAKLGLTGQPRAVIFHMKEDGRGRMREHCHVVWSRIDAGRGKAVQLSFSKEKLMTVTREFARDHGLTLPDGYRRHEEKVRQRNRQLTAYDSVKQKETGITHAERMAAVTDAWKRSDSGKAFVSALEDLGYVLARGRNGSRLVLVDIYGYPTALTRLIDDPAVRAKHVRDRLGPDYAPENLPTVEEAQAIAADRRKAIDEFEKVRRDAAIEEHVIKRQQERRQGLEAEAARLKDRQKAERADLADKQKTERQALKTEYLAQVRRLRSERAQRAPKGLAAFLGRITGVALITKKVQRYRDGKRFEAYLERKHQIAERQREQQAMLARRHELQRADMDRRLRALDQIDKRELASIEQSRTTERRRQINARHRHMPAFSMELKPPGRPAAPHKAKNRYISPVRRALEEPEAEKAQEKKRPITLSDAFAKVAREEETGRGDSAGSAASDAPHPLAEPKIARRKRRDTERLKEFNEAARGSEEKRTTPSPSPYPEAEPKPERKRLRDTERLRAFNESARGNEDGRSAPSPSPHPEGAPKIERKKLRDTERLHRFNEAARGDEGDSRDEGAADAPAPAGEAKIRRRKRRRDRDRDSMRASDREDRRRDDDGYDSAPRKRRRARDRDSPGDEGPPRPPRTRRRDFDRGM